MTKADIVNEVSRKTGISRDEVLRTLESFMDTVKNSLGKDENVYMRTFGSFIVKDLPGRAQGCLLAAARRPLGLDDLPHVPVGPELQQPGSVQCDGGRDAGHCQPGRRDPASGRGGLRLEAPGHDRDRKSVV